MPELFYVERNYEGNVWDRLWVVSDFTGETLQIMPEKRAIYEDDY